MAIAGSAAECAEESEPQFIDLVPKDVRVEKNGDDHVQVSFNLYAPVEPTEGDTSANARFFEFNLIGWGRMDVRLSPDNGFGEFEWELGLVNGDFIKGVTGEMILERNSALLPGDMDPNIAVEEVDEWYGTGTLYTSARGGMPFSCPSDLESDQNLKLRWENFRIEGVLDRYRVPRGTTHGTTADFS